MSSSVSIVLIVLLLGGSLYLRRRPEPAAAGLRLVLSLMAMAIALWSLWTTAGDHGSPDAAGELSAVRAPAPADAA